MFSSFCRTVEAEWIVFFLSIAMNKDNCLCRHTVLPKLIFSKSNQALTVRNPFLLRKGTTKNIAVHLSNLIYLNKIAVELISIHYYSNKMEKWGVERSWFHALFRTIFTQTKWRVTIHLALSYAYARKSHSEISSNTFGENIFLNALVLHKAFSHFVIGIFDNIIYEKLCVQWKLKCHPKLIEYYTVNWYSQTKPRLNLCVSDKT